MSVAHDGKPCPECRANARWGNALIGFVGGGCLAASLASAVLPGMWTLVATFAGATVGAVVGWKATT